VSELLVIDIERHGAATVARMVGEVDMSNAVAVSEQLRRAIDGAGGSLVLDMTGVEYADSAWFAAMHALATSLADAGAELRLVCPPAAPIRRTLEVAGIDLLVPVHPSPEAALAEG
jgi:anti-anti-sigma factor